MQAAIDWRCVGFDALLLDELHALLALRQDVFVLEQRCLYADIDGRDPGALHLLGHLDGALTAYARIFPPGEAGSDDVRMGRIVTARHARGQGVGRHLVEAALREAALRWPACAVVIAAQAHLVDYYASFGFEAISAAYEEDGIAHVDMRRRR